ncbi:MAG: macro domain-containing protein [Oxalobacter sp.]|nr:macro domain-containing protein [Oxalobacter sp.]
MERKSSIIALERAIANYRFRGNASNPWGPLFNALCAAMKDGLEIYVGIEDSKERTAGGGDAKYYVPLFTDQKEMQKGGSMSVINVSLEKLFSKVEDGNFLGYYLNPYSSQIQIDKDIIKKLLVYQPRPQICVLTRSVVDMQVGAIVNAANASLLGGGGVDRAIHAAAGLELHEACKKLGGCEPGKAKITKAYGIQYADYIIHAVSPIYHGTEQDEELLASCYTASLDLALDNGCTSIAFPSLATGGHGYPLDEAAEVAVESVRIWLDSHPDVVMDIYFCCFTKEERAVYDSLV